MKGAPVPADTEAVARLCREQADRGRRSHIIFFTCLIPSGEAWPNLDVELRLQLAVESLIRNSMYFGLSPCRTSQSCRGL